MKKITIVLLLFSIFPVSPVFADYLDNPRLQSLLRSVSDPKLIYPSNEEVDLSGKDSFEFHWALYSTNLVSRDYIEFRLYEGEKTGEDNLILEKQLSPDTYSMKVNPRLFEEGKIYTWSIRQFFLRGQGSGASAASFKVIKKS
jgi:hypothetical protein